MRKFKILIVDDELAFREAYRLILSDHGYYTSAVTSGEECLELLKKESFDLVVTDLIMGGMNGLALLTQIKGNFPLCEVIMVTGYGSVESAVQAIKHGAFGYFVKGQDPDLLLLDIEKLVKIKALQMENRNMQYEIKNAEYMLTTKNAQFREVIAIAQKVAASNSNVLILGESGTGKEVAAKFIHRASERKNRGFVPVNCQMFAEGVLESELFGHEKGAFTGAAERRIGRFEEADGGTIFLDEIGELTLATQAKLLRVLENRSFERIGSNKPISTDIRLICATNRKLHDEIKRGNFREDLLYRINTITLCLPPLRERKEDIPDLIQFFLIKFANEMKKKIAQVDETLMERLLQYDYPGNIRELRNIVERLLVLSDNGILEAENLPDLMLESRTKQYGNFELKSLKDVKIEAEANHIMKALKQCDGNISAAARALDISRRQLFNKIVDYGIKD